MFVRRGPAIVLSLGLSAAALVMAPSAVASDGGIAKDKEGCANSSTVKVKVLLADDGRLEATGIVWSDDDDVWSWKFKHDGDVSFDGEVKAKDADKSFKITRKMVNFAGPDNILFRAVNQSTGEVCRVDVNF